jgi:transcriptional antiterminator RfaH
MNPTNPTNSSDMRWYCLRTKRYKESWAARQLMEVCNEIYLPLLRQQRTVRRQRKWVVEPLFPGYLFARFVVEERFRAVRYTPGVIDVLRTAAGGPIEVDEAIIATLHRRSQNGYVEVLSAPFFPGEELEITEGPFQGLRALFQQELKAGERVAVLLDLLSSRVRVELPRVCVEKKSEVAREQLVA